MVVISHDFAGMEELCPRTLDLRDGVLERGLDGGRGPVVTTAPPNESATRRPARPVVLLRPVPGRSAVHELWAGTKLLAVGGISVLLTFYPGWIAIGLVAALVLTAGRIAHIPRGALPSRAALAVDLLALGGLSAAFAGGSPVIELAGVPSDSADC